MQRNLPDDDYIREDQWGFRVNRRGWHIDCPDRCFGCEAGLDNIWHCEACENGMFR